METEMYVWEVRLQVEWESVWNEKGKVKYDTWDDTDSFTVASPTGFGAIEKARKLALANAQIFDNSDYKDDDETIKTNKPVNVDVVYLELKETLDA